MPTHPQSPSQRIHAVLGHQPVLPVPRGELWLGSELFEREGLTDTVENHFRLADRLGHEIVCLPVARDFAHIPDLGYRYFEIEDLSGAIGHGDAYVAAVIDGPFQTLVNRQGLMTVLTQWVRQRRELVEAFAIQHAQTIELIERSLACGIHGIVIADDLSADRGPLISPEDIDSLCGSFYRDAVQKVHAANANLLIHCCGNINPLVPLYQTWGIDGLAAVQSRTNDLVALRQQWSRPPAIMAGIDAELLAFDSPPLEATAALERLVAALAPCGGLILGSACGLYRGEFLPRIKRLYAHVDRLLEKASPPGR